MQLWWHIKKPTKQKQHLVQSLAEAVCSTSFSVTVPTNTWDIKMQTSKLLYRSLEHVSLEKNPWILRSSSLGPEVGCNISPWKKTLKRIHSLFRIYPILDAVLGTFTWEINFYLSHHFLQFTQMRFSDSCTQETTWRNPNISFCPCNCHLIRELLRGVW